MSPERRERRSFEPPPWEKQQFEELERKAPEEDAEEAAGGQEESEPSTAMSAQGPTAARQGSEQEPASEGSGEGKGDTAALLAAVPEVKKEAAPPDAGIDPARMAELMAGLRSDDPPATGAWKLGLAVSVGMAVLGAVMMIWGIVGLQATRGAGQLGWMGAAVLISFGAGFIAAAAWFAYKNLEKRGVL
jgi:hypothetical protein